MQSAQLVNRFEYFDSVASTNLELKRHYLANPGSWPDFSAIAAAQQTAGRGRLGRSWVSEPGSSISVSLLLRPETEAQQTWLTLIAGLAVADVVSSLLPEQSVGVKWPNDVLVEGKKISGILAELIEPGVVVLGIGVNLARQQSFADSAALADFGLEPDFDSVLALLLAALRGRYNLSNLSFGLAQLRDELADHCLTLGQQVRAELPDGRELVGIATEIDSDGQLIIQADEAVALSAADVWHLRN